MKGTTLRIVALTSNIRDLVLEGGEEDDDVPHQVEDLACLLSIEALNLVNLVRQRRRRPSLTVLETPWMHAVAE